MTTIDATKTVISNYKQHTQTQIKQLFKTKSIEILDCRIKIFLIQYASCYKVAKKSSDTV